MASQKGGSGKTTLSSSSLARKGGAKPAMRRRELGQADPLASSADDRNADLGWNDMGSDDDLQDRTRPETSLKTEATEQAGTEEAIATYIGQPASPSNRGAREWATDRPSLRKTNKGRKGSRSRPGKAKAAFTLRLDAERHLKLRLATTMQNISAQQLITKAMDEYLKTIPELDDLAERVPSR